MTVRGIDVSTWQHPDGEAIDWHQVADAGYRFMVVKATQGTSYVNPWLSRDLEDAHAAGLFVGAYHYFEAGVDPQAQAQHYVATMMGRHLQIYSWLDYEVPVQNGFEAGTEIHQFLEAARDGRPGMGLYVSGWLLDLLRQASQRLPKLWVASWNTPSAPAGSDVWQDATNRTVPGVPAPVDTDVLVSLRGLNLDSSPRPRPAVTAADVAAVRSAAVEGAAEAETAPEDTEPAPVS